MTINEMIAHYNELDKVRHNLYKKRSAKILATARKLRTANGDPHCLLVSWSSYRATAKALAWGIKDELALQRARAEVKQFGLLVSKVLKKHKLLATRRAGGNKIVELVERK
jgi:hypothetical protein